ncbi:hypothetical protein GCM10027075_27020 [Streptomyces heilongjiangensis]
MLLAGNQLPRTVASPVVVQQILTCHLRSGFGGPRLIAGRAAVIAGAAAWAVARSIDYTTGR